MKLFILAFVLISQSAFATATATCELVSGVYSNSLVPVSDLRFETLVDVFTINNANSLTLSLDGQALRLLRKDLLVERSTTKLIYLQRKQEKVIRAAYVLLDRKPKEASSSKAFFANIIITDELEETDDYTKVFNLRTFNYNFSCKF